MPGWVSAATVLLIRHREDRARINIYICFLLSLNHCRFDGTDDDSLNLKELTSQQQQAFEVWHQISIIVLSSTRIRSGSIKSLLLLVYLATYILIPSYSCLLITYILARFDVPPFPTLHG